MRNFIKNILVGLFIYIYAINSYAVSSQASGVTHFSTEDTVKFSKQVERSLAAKGARVFIISRVGRPVDELPPGFNYTHTGIGVYSIITTTEGKNIPGYTMYNLYQKNDRPDKSELIQDYPVDFFSGVYKLQAGIIIPKPELQKRILQVINSDTYMNLHNPEYSAIANPFNRTYQNCTEHTLDVLNAAIYNTADIEQLKTNSKEYFDAQKVKVNPFKMLIGSMFSSDISVSDHDEKIETATFTTIGKYLQEYDLVQEQFSIALKQ